MAKQNMQTAASSTTNTELVNQKGNQSDIVQPIKPTRTNAEYKEILSKIGGEKLNKEYSRGELFSGATLNTQARKEFADINDFVEYTRGINLDAGREVAMLARGDNQSGGERLLHGITRIGSTAATDFMAFAGEIIALAQPTTYQNPYTGNFYSGKQILDNIVNNPMSKGLRDFNDWVTENTQVYSRTIDQEYEEDLFEKMTSSTFWGNEGAHGMGFFIGSFIPSILMEAASLGAATPIVAAKMGRFTLQLAKLARMAKTADRSMKAWRFGANAYKRVGTWAGQTLAQTAQESATEAAFVSTEIEEKLRARMEAGELDPNTGMPYTEESIMNYKHQALTRSMSDNMAALFFSNAIETVTIFGRKKPSLSNFKRAEKFANRTAKQKMQDLVTKRGGAVLSSAASEAILEEGVQTTSEGIIKDDILEGQYVTDDVQRLLQTYLKNAISDKDTQVSMLLGGLLGAGGSIFGQTMKAVDEKKFYSKVNAQRQDLQNIIKNYGTDIYKTNEKGEIVTDPETNLPVKDWEKIAKNMKSMKAQIDRQREMDRMLQNGDREGYIMEYLKDFASIALQYAGHDAGFYAFQEDIQNMPAAIKEQLIGKDSLIANEEFKTLMGEVAKVTKETFQTVFEGRDDFVPVDAAKMAEEVVGYDQNNIQQDTEEYALLLAKMSAISKAMEHGSKSLLDKLENNPLVDKIDNLEKKKKVYSEYNEKYGKGFEDTFNNKKDRNADFKLFLEEKTRMREDLQTLTDRLVKKDISKQLGPELSPIFDRHTYVEAVYNPKENQQYGVQHSAIVELTGVKLDSGTPNRWRLQPVLKDTEITLVNEKTNDVVSIKQDLTLIYKGKRLSASWGINELVSAKEEAARIKESAFRKAMQATKKFYRERISSLEEGREQLKKDIKKHKRYLSITKDSNKIENRKAVISDLEKQLESYVKAEAESEEFLAKLQELGEDATEIEFEDIKDAIEISDKLVRDTLRSRDLLQRRLDELRNTTDATEISKIKELIQDTIDTEEKAYSEALTNKVILDQYLREIDKAFAELYPQIFASQSKNASPTTIPTPDVLSDSQINDMGSDMGSETSTLEALPFFSSWTSFLKTAMNEELILSENDAQRLATLDFVKNGNLNDVTVEVVSRAQLSKVAEAQGKFEDPTNIYHWLRFYSTAKKADGTPAGLVADAEIAAYGYEEGTDQDIKIVFKRNGQYIKHKGEYVYASLPTPSFNSTNDWKRFRNQEGLSEAEQKAGIEAYEAFREMAKAKPITLAIQGRTGGKFINARKTSQLNNSVVGTVFESEQELLDALNANPDDVVHTVSAEKDEAAGNVTTTTAGDKTFTAYNGMSYINYKGRWMLLKNRQMTEDDIQLALDLIIAAKKSQDADEIERVDNWLKAIIHNTPKNFEGKYAFRLEGHLSKTASGKKKKAVIGGIVIGENFVSADDLVAGKQEAIDAFKTFMRTKRYNMTRHEFDRFMYPTRTKDGVKWNKANTKANYFKHMLESGERFTVGLNTIESGERNLVNISINFAPSGSDLNYINAKTKQKQTTPDNSGGTVAYADVVAWQPASSEALKTSEKPKEGAYYAIQYQRFPTIKNVYIVKYENGKFTPIATQLNSSKPRGFKLINDPDVMTSTTNQLEKLFKDSGVTFDDKMFDASKTKILEVSPEVKSQPLNDVDAALNWWNSLSTSQKGNPDFYQDSRKKLLDKEVAEGRLNKTLNGDNNSTYSKISVPTAMGYFNFPNKGEYLVDNEDSKKLSAENAFFTIDVNAKVHINDQPKSLDTLLKNGVFDVLYDSDNTFDPNIHKGVVVLEAPELKPTVKGFKMASKGLIRFIEEPAVYNKGQQIPIQGAVEEGTTALIKLPKISNAVPVIYKDGKWQSQALLSGTSQAARNRGMQVQAALKFVDNQALTVEQAFNHDNYSVISTKPAPKSQQISGNTETLQERYEKHKAILAKKNKKIAPYEEWLKTQKGGVHEIWSPYANKVHQLDEGLAWYAAKFPGIPVEIIQNALVEGVGSAKLRQDMVLMVSSLAAGETLFHEGFHTANLVFNTRAQRKALYNETRKRLGNTVVKINTKDGIVSVAGKDLTDALAEEFLATEFKEFMLANGKYQFPKGEPLKRNLFERIWDAIQSLFSSKKKNIEQYFDYVASNPEFAKQGDVWIPDAAFEIADLSGRDSARYVADLNYRFFQKITSDGASAIDGVEFGTRMLLNFDAKRDAEDIYLQLMMEMQPDTMEVEDWIDIFDQLQEQHRKFLQRVSVSVDLYDFAESTVSEDEQTGRSMEEKLSDVSISEADKIRVALKLFLLGVPQVDAMGEVMQSDDPLLVDGHAVQTIVNTQYRELIHSLHNMLHDVPESRIPGLLRENRNNIPGVGYILDKLKMNPGDKADKYTLVLRNAFFNQFSKTKSNPSIMRYDAASQSVEFTSPLFDAFRDKVKSVWQNEISTGTPLFKNGKLEVANTAYTFLSGVSKKVNTLTASQFKTFAEKNKFLKELGLDLETIVPDFTPTQEFNAAVDKFITRFFQNMSKVASSNNGILDGKDLFNPQLMKLQGEINALTNQILSHSKMTDELSYRDAEYKNRYSIGEHTYLTNLSQHVRYAASLSSREERLRALRELSMAPYMNNEGALMLTNEFFVNLVERGIPPGSDILQITNIESVMDGTEKGKYGFAKFTDGDLIISYFNHVFSGKMPVPRTGSRKIENFISNEDLMRTDMTEERYMNNMLEFFYSEVARTWALKDGIGTDLHNYSKNAQTLFSFEDLLGENGWLELQEFMNSDSSRKDNVIQSIEEFFLENIEYLDKTKASIQKAETTSIEKMREEMELNGIVMPSKNPQNVYIKGIDPKLIESVLGNEVKGTRAGVEISLDQFNTMLEQFVRFWDVGIELSTRIMVNDPAHLKNAGEVFKRFNGGNSTRQLQSLSEVTNNDLNVAYPKINGDTYTNTARVKMFADELVTMTDGTMQYMSPALQELYNNALKKGAEGSDAQAVMMPDFGREIMLRHGAWLDKHERTYQYEMQKHYIKKAKAGDDAAVAMFTDGVFSKHTGNKIPNKPMFDGREISEFDLTPLNTIKIQNFGRSPGMTQTDAKGWITPFDFTKNSQAWAWPSQYQDTQLFDSLMEQKIDYLTFPTGKKGDRPAVLQELIDTNGDTVTQSDENGVYEESLFNYGIQVETPYKSKDKVTLSKQLNRLLFNHLYGPTSSIISPETQTLVNRLYEDYNRLIEVSTKRAVDDLSAALGFELDANGNVLSFQKEGFSERLLSALDQGYISKDMFDNIQEIIDSDTPYMELSPMSGTIESNILSIIRKEGVQHKVLGRMLIQESDSVHRIKRDRKLKMYRKEVGPNGTLVTKPMQIRMALSKSQYAFVIEKYGSLSSFNRLLAAGKLPEEMYLMTGNRIPSDDTHSMDYMEVVEFFPPWHGDRIVLPVEAVIKSGTDFDVDKMTTYFNSWVDKYYDVKNADQLAELADHLVDPRNSNQQVGRLFNYIKRYYPNYNLNAIAAQYGFDASKDLVDQVQTYIEEILDEQSALHEHREYLMQSEAYAEELENLKALKEQRSKLKPQEKIARIAINEQISESNRILKEAIILGDKAGEYGTKTLTQFNTDMKQLIESREEQRAYLADLIIEVVEDLGLDSADVNTQAAVQTEMNKIRMQVLALPESFENLMQPTVTSGMKALANTMNQEFGRENTDAIPSHQTLKSWNVLQNASKMMASQGGVGIVATAVVNHAFTRQHPINVNSPYVRMMFGEGKYTSYSTNTYKLGETNETVDGENITHLLTEILNSFLDAEKDPFINDTGISIQTLPIVQALLRIAPVGGKSIGIKDIARLMNMPLMRENMRLKKGSIVNPGLNIFERTVQLLDIKYNQSLAGLYGSIQKKKYNNQYYGKQEDQLIARLNLIPVITPAELLDMNNLSEARQKQILEIMMYYEKIGGDLTTFTTNTRFDSSMPNSKSGVRLSLYSQEQGFKRILAFQQDGPNSMNAMMDKTYLKHYKDVYKSVQSMIGELFLSEDPIIAETTAAIESKLADEFMRKEEKELYMRTLENNLVGHIITSIELNGKDSILDELPELVKGENSVAKQLLDWKASGLLDNNEFFNELYANIDKFDRYRGRTEGFDNVQTFSRRISPEDLEAIKQDLITTLDMNVDEIDEFVNRLVKLAVAQTGMQGKRGSYNSLLPASKFFNVLQPRARAWKNLDDDAKRTMISGFADIFYANKWYDSNIVPRLSLTYKDNRTGQMKNRLEDGIESFTYYKDEPAFTIQYPMVSDEEAKKLRKKKLPIPTETLYYINAGRADKYKFNYVLADKQGAPMLYEGSRSSVIEMNYKDNLIARIKQLRDAEGRLTEGISELPMTKYELDRMRNKEDFTSNMLSTTEIKNNVVESKVTMPDGFEFTYRNTVHKGIKLKPFKAYPEDYQSRFLDSLGYSSVEELISKGTQLEKDYVNGQVENVIVYNVEYDKRFQNKENTSKKSDTQKSTVSQADSMLRKFGLTQSMFDAVYEPAFSKVKVEIALANKAVTVNHPIIIGALNDFAQLHEETLELSKEEILMDFENERKPNESLDEFIQREYCK